MGLLDDAIKANQPGTPSAASTNPPVQSQSAPQLSSGGTSGGSLLDQAIAANTKTPLSLTQPTADLAKQHAEQGTLAANAVVGNNPLDVGVAKGALETAHTVGAAIGHVLPNSWRDKIGLPTSFTEPDYLQSANGAETAGKVGESLAEYALGDSALKSLVISERLGIASKLAQVAKSSPYIARILELGMNATRGGVVTVPQQIAHGATPTEALKTGAEAVATGALTGAVAEGVGAAKNALDTGVIQEPLKSGVRNILGNVADETGVTRSASPSIRKVAEDTADAVYTKSKSQYAVLDEVTGGRFQRFKDRLENIRQSLNGLTGTEEDAAQEASLLKAQKETEDAMQEAFNDAKAKGVDPKLVDEANGNFKKSQALYDLDSNIKKTVSGGRPGVTPSEQLRKAQELIDPKKFLNRVNTLYDSGRLQDALGPKGADDLFNHALENSVNHSQILRNQRLAKYGVIGLGLTGIGGEVAKHALGE